MTDATVDASIWIAAADPADVFHQESRTFLAAIALLISWDQELIQRAGALTPTDWLNANP